MSSPDDPEPRQPTAEEFAKLTARVRALEERLGFWAAAPNPRTQTATRKSVPPLPQAPAEAPPHIPAAPPLSLEARIGTQWFGRVGVIAILCGVAWLLKWAIDYGWLGPDARVILGLVAGLGFFAWAERVWRKHLPLTAYALFAVGNGVIYLSVWAGVSLYGLFGRTEALALMAALTLWNGYRSWTNDSRQFAVYALLLGFLIPLLLANGENHEIELFAFLLMLDSAVAVLAVLKPWRFLLPSALAGTVVLMLGWATRFLASGDWLPMALFTAALAVLFGWACRGICVRRTTDADDSMHATLLPILVTLLGTIGVWVALLAASERADRTWIAALVLGLISLGLFAMTQAEADGNRLGFRLTQYGLALALLTLTVLLHFRGTTLPLILALEGVIMTAVSVRWRNLVASRPTALVALFLAALLSMTYLYGGDHVFWNPVVGLGLVSLIALGASLWVLARARTQGGDRDGSRLLPLSFLQAVLAVSAVVLLWVIGLRMIHIAWWGSAGYLSSLRAAALRFGSQFSYSAWCMAYGAALLAVGFWRRFASLRWQGLLLLVLAAGKVFLYDMSALSQGWRVLSFFGLGALLLLVSFAYQRDWLALRRAQT